jgi:hypothetical protein
MCKSPDSDNKKFTLKDAYEELWRCRDFELTHLWQRSIFLGAFLLASFAGYGQLIAQWSGQARGFSALDNVMGFVVAITGLVLALMWVMLAKGSKAWYERYENAIYHFVKIANISQKTKKELYDEGVEKIIGFAYGDNGFEAYSASVSSWLWNTKGGSYSPSKINIAIGHLAVVVWLTAISFHIAVARWGVKKVAALAVSHCDLALAMMSLLVFGLLLFWLYAKAFLKSGILEEKQ